MRALRGDTIAAISTAIGPGAIAVVRMSGGRAIEIADAVFRGREPLREAATRTAHHGTIVDGEGCVVDEVLLTVLRSPHSYTTEDMIEIGCHGGPMPARRVLDACLSAGARVARAGEFTERAFIAGRIDLVQAEAVADIVGARTRRGLEAALGQLAGTLSDAVSKLRERILCARAEVEAFIDFPEEDIEAAGRDVVLRMIEEAGAATERMLEHCEYGLAIRDGISAALVGKPNVGKSSLMNALLMRDRSIVTAEPGTTRDAIEECLHVGGVAVRLIDTAGWREAGNAAERAGVERARAAARGAALTVLVVSGVDGLDEADHEIAGSLHGSRTVVAVNKTDLDPPVSEEKLSRLLGTMRGGRPKLVTRVSALASTGVGALRLALVEAALGSPPSEESLLVTNARHRDALVRARSALERAERAWAEGAPPELAAVELMEASASVGDITGETTPEDVLARIFERFCVGK